MYIYATIIETRSLRARMASFERFSPHAPVSSDDIEDSASKGSSNREGTTYQAQLAVRAHRAHFFSPLDPAYSEAVHRDAESVEFTADEEVQTG